MCQNVTNPEQRVLADLRCLIAVLIPSVPLAQRSDVRNVVATVPGVLGQEEIDTGEPPLGVPKLARPVGGPE